MIPPTTLVFLISVSVFVLPQTCCFSRSETSNKTPLSSSLFAKKKGGASAGGGFGTVEKVTSTGHTGAKALRKATNNYDRLKKESDGDLTFIRDLYVRSPQNNERLFWFVGKVICDPKSSITVKSAALAQKRLILDYAKLKLRPNNFGGKYAKTLEIWLAPGDSEMDTVQNKVSLEQVTGSLSSLPQDLDRNCIGYNPEIYVGEEIEKGGLRVERDDNGDPTRPVFEVNESL